MKRKKLKISILTLFPQMFESPFSHSIIKRAIDKKLLEITYVHIRDFGIGKHKLVDDSPYGGGVGMVMRFDVVEKAIEAAKCTTMKCRERICLMDAGGETFTQNKAYTYATYDHLILICARYEGIDHRIRTCIDDEISIGDYILTGGEIPAMVITDAVSRLLPGVLGKDASSKEESFQLSENASSHTLLEYPQYTKPALYKKLSVPDVLLSGNHQRIAAWRKKERVARTQKNRPDLLTKNQIPHRPMKNSPKKMEQDQK